MCISLRVPKSEKLQKHCVLGLYFLGYLLIICIFLQVVQPVILFCSCRFVCFTMFLKALLVFFFPLWPSILHCKYETSRTFTVFQFFPSFFEIAVYAKVFFVFSFFSSLPTSLPALSWLFFLFFILFWTHWNLPDYRHKPPCLVLIYIS